MSSSAPAVSILIATYNRSHLLRRAIASVLMQDFTDFELIIIDDCSTDDTPQVVTSIADPRIRYFRNEVNVGSKAGDRPHMRRFVYELMRGKYFVYLCDDDYWLYPNLLQSQVLAFKMYKDVVMVMGGQLSYFLTTPESYLGRDPDDPITFSLNNIDRYFDVDTLTSKCEHVRFMGGTGPGKSLFSKLYMTAREFLDEFAADPAEKNIIGGAMLYSRDAFIQSGGFAKDTGSQWQAGYELKMGPACFGSVVYFNEPSIVTEIRSGNASFRGTQIEHYKDSIVSIERAFEVPLKGARLRAKRAYLKHIRAVTVRNIGRSYLRNTIEIRRNRALTLCDANNMAQRVTYREVFPALIRNGALHTLRPLDIKLLIATVMPDGLFRMLDRKQHTAPRQKIYVDSSLRR